MIHVVTVLAGTSSYAQIAQRHAVRMAQLFHARLRVATVWEPESAGKPRRWARRGRPLPTTEVERISREAGNADILVEKSLRGEGLPDGLLAEARESDLLVVGLPECPTGEELVCRAIRHDEMPLLHKAECLVLVAYRDPAPIQSVLVDYPGGTEGKAALRAAGEVAIRTSAAVTVLSVNGSRENAEMLTSSARRYLEGFGTLEYSEYGARGTAGLRDRGASCCQVGCGGPGGRRLETDTACWNGSGAGPLHSRTNSRRPCRGRSWSSGRMAFAQL